ncbi:hypothetical protein [Pseudodesulfovibrio sp. JC047]|uniref:hypothetical protein n=1 Tax=Pseudodesulfovibrio sp. JC047 TaxID=2683199 RepID=UPI00193FD655|nr:hypothetical protein [Pseudodesulfovibrio sp. JC047]
MTGCCRKALVCLSVSRANQISSVRLNALSVFSLKSHTVFHVEAEGKPSVSMRVLSTLESPCVYGFWGIGLYGGFCFLVINHLFCYVFSVFLIVSVKKGVMTVDNEIQTVTVKNIDMSMWNMCRFMVKWVIASIPAIFILCVLSVLVAGLLGGLGAMFQ